MEIIPVPEMVIADTQVLIIEGLKALLSAKYNISCVAGSKAELLSCLKQHEPKILMLDYCLLDFDNLEELENLKKTYNKTGIVILTNHISNQDIHDYNKAGIKHILHKTADAGEIMQCLDCLLKGKKYYSEYILDLLFEQNKKSPLQEPSQLTASEIEILRHIADGLTNKEIAAKKCLSIHTITTHRKNILRKLDVSNASELIMVAIRKGLIGTIDYQI
jgi:DNA-binding NarL/FixJ family response regulator